MTNNELLPAAAHGHAPCEEVSAFSRHIKATCGFCGGESWIDPESDDPCRKCRHQLIVAAMASLGGGLPPEKMAEMSIKAADAVLCIRLQGRGLATAAGNEKG